MITLKRTSNNCLQVTLNNKAIPVQNETKYFGVVIDK